MKTLKKEGNFLRAAGIISAATMLSRVLGLVREQVFAYYFGAGRVTDAFQIAFRIPNLLRDLFAEGSMSSALVPIYMETRAQKGEASAWDLVNKLVSVLGVAIICISILGIFFSREIIGIFPLEGDAEKFDLTVRLTQVMIPFLPTVMFAAIWMSILNARERYATPALAPALFNIIGIFSAFTFCPLLAKYGIEPIFGMAAGVLLGGLGQWWVQVPNLRREGYRFRFCFAWRDSELAKITALMGFGAISMAATQVNVMVNSFLALSEGDGPVSWLNYAFRLMQFPIGVFGVAIAQVTLTKVAQSTAVQDIDDVKATVVRSLRVAVAITLPSAVGLAVFGYPIISVIYERGLFHTDHTAATAWALACYAIGLTGYSCNKIMVPVLYSLKKANRAVVSSLLSVASNIILCLVLVRVMGFAGLALGASLAAYVNFLTLLFWIAKYAGGLDWRHLLGGVVRSVFASLIMGVALWYFWSHFKGSWGNLSFFIRLLLLSAGLSLGAGTYWLCIRWLGLSEAKDIESMVLRRFKRT